MACNRRERRRRAGSTSRRRGVVLRSGRSSNSSTAATEYVKASKSVLIQKLRASAAREVCKAGSNWQNPYAFERQDRVGALLCR